MKMKRITGYIIPGFIMGICLWSMAGCASSDQAAESHEVSVKVSDSIEVESTHVQLRDFHPVARTTGTLEPRRHAVLRTRVDGEIVKLPVDVGSVVSQNDLLFQSRRTGYALAFEQAEANLRQAEAAFKDARREKDRMVNLFREGFATEQMRDRAEAAYEQAEAALAQARAARNNARRLLEDCTVRAPYGGVITARFLEEGEFAHKGEPVVEIMDLSTLNAEVDVAERFAGNIKSGIDAHITIQATGEKITGIVTNVSPKIDASSRTFLVKIAIENKDNKYQAGLFVSVEIPLPPHTHRLAIPQSAIVRDEGRSFVWTIKDGTAHKVEISEGLSEDGWIEVLSGVTEDTIVITSSLGALKEGDQISTKQ